MHNVRTRMLAVAVLAVPLLGDSLTSSRNLVALATRASEFVGTASRFAYKRS